MGSLKHADLKSIVGIVVPALTLSLVMACTAPEPEIPPVTIAVDINTEPTAPCADYTAERRAYFGDLHVHTSYSHDGHQIDTRNVPADAYQFAKGQQVGILPYDEFGNPLRTAQLAPGRELDFAMVSDHAEFFGDKALCENPASVTYNHPNCVDWREQNTLSIVLNIALGATTGNVGAHCRDALPGEGFSHTCFEHSITLWQELQQQAHSAYDRCNFTTFVGYEWSGAPAVPGNVLSAQGIHRNVMFRGANVPERPFSFFQGTHPQQLWESLESDCTNAAFPNGEACEALSIPHNSNLSNGLMFAKTDKHGQPIDLAYTQLRSSYERVAEVIQHKGASECLNTAFGGTDEECNFETVPYGSMGAEFVEQSPVPISIPEPDPKSFVRDALKEGLISQVELGGNPFKLGMIGSTDTHLGTPGLVAEQDMPGHFALHDTPGAQPRESFSDNTWQNPGGLAVVWAEQNSRDSLFDAIKRRETYATSGPRHEVRFFGGYSYSDTLCASQNLVTTGYAEGVPMGGDLPASPGTAPKFVVSALADIDGHKLAKIQIVKGYIDSNGEAQEEVYTLPSSVTVPDSNVDLNTCTVGTAGNTAMCEVWTDPAFDASTEAFYYAKVIEVPSCRWTQLQCLEAGISYDNNGSCLNAAPTGMEACCTADVPKTITERSWTSPIWYTPSS